jgi:hypothetical protein
VPHGFGVGFSSTFFGEKINYAQHILYWIYVLNFWLTNVEKNVMKSVSLQIIKYSYC